MTAIRQCRAGAAALEFALVAPLFIALVAGTVELARWGWGAAVLRDAAAQGARCLRVTPDRCGSAAALRAWLGEPEGVQAIVVTKSACGLRFTTRGGYPAALTPGLGVTSASACAPAAAR